MYKIKQMKKLIDYDKCKGKGCGRLIPVDSSDSNSESWQCGQYYDALERVVYCDKCRKGKKSFFKNYLNIILVFTYLCIGLSFSAYHEDIFLLLGFGVTFIPFTYFMLNKKSKGGKK